MSSIRELIFGENLQGYVRTGKFCESCGGPMIAKQGVVLKYDTNTGKPIYGHGDPRCEGDKFCGMWGMPGF